MEPQQILEQSNISIAIDTYDDIFSDFDPRPFAHRALSDDFLIEAKKAVIDKDDKLELRFMIPSAARNLTSETIIRKRLRDHFQKHAFLLKRERKEEIVWGGLITVTGFALITAGTFVYNSETFWQRLLLVILEPSGWFTMWHGFDRMLDAIKNNASLEFYQKMTKASVTFETY